MFISKEHLERLDRKIFSLEGQVKMLQMQVGRKYPKNPGTLIQQVDGLYNHLGLRIEVVNAKPAEYKVTAEPPPAVTETTVLGTAPYPYYPPLTWRIV